MSPASHHKRQMCFPVQASEDEQPNMRVRDVDQCTPLHLSLLHGMNCPSTLPCPQLAEIMLLILLLDTHSKP